MQNDYIGFISSAYAISVLALVGIAAWVFLDARAQKRALKDLEARGIRRRSASAAPATGAEATR